MNKNNELQFIPLKEQIICICFKFQKSQKNIELNFCNMTKIFFLIYMDKKIIHIYHFF